MRVTFQIMGRPSFTLNLDGGSTVGEACTLADVPQNCSKHVNRRPVESDHELSDGDTVQVTKKEVVG